MKKTRFIHIVIAAVAVANLVVLFLFQYGLSDATPAVQAAKRAAAERAAAHPSSNKEGQATDASAEGEDGQTDGDVSEGEDGQNGEASAQNEGADSAEASTNGSVEGGNGSGTGTDGTGTGSNGSEDGFGGSSDSTGDGTPTITITSTLPTVELADLPHIVTTLVDLGYLSADDGFGNDITSQVTADYEEVSEDSADYNVTFSVTNSRGTTVTETRTITTQAGTKPVLELTAPTITLSVGDNFYYMSYIKTARDVDGTSLDTRISISGVVDTSTPGTYQLEYWTTSRVNSERVSKTLTIIVQ